MLSALRPKAQPYLKKLARPFYGIDPNILTIIGVLPAFLFVYFMFSEQYIWALVMFAGIPLDALDGMVARETGRVTAFGGVLDSSLDRLADALFITGFGFAGLVRWEIVIALLISSYLISYIRSRAELAGKAEFKLDVGLIERSERILVLFLSLVLYRVKPGFNVADLNLVELIWLILIGLSLVTIRQRLSRSRSLLDAVG